MSYRFLYFVLINSQVIGSGTLCIVNLHVIGSGTLCLVNLLVLVLVL